MERDQLEQWLCGPDVIPAPPREVAAALGLPVEALADTTTLRTLACVRSLRLTLAVLRDAFADDTDVDGWLDTPHDALDGASPRTAIVAGRTREVEALAVDVWNETACVVMEG